MQRKPEGGRGDAPKNPETLKTKKKEKKEPSQKDRLMAYLAPLRMAQEAAKKSNTVLAGELQACVRAIENTVDSIDNFGKIPPDVSIPNLVSRIEKALAVDPKERTTQPFYFQ